MTGVWKRVGQFPASNGSSADRTGFSKAAIQHGGKRPHRIHRTGYRQGGGETGMFIVERRTLGVFAALGVESSMVVGIGPITQLRRLDQTKPRSDAGECASMLCILAPPGGRSGTIRFLERARKCCFRLVSHALGHSSEGDAGAFEAQCRDLHAPLSQILHGRNTDHVHKSVGECGA